MITEKRSWWTGRSILVEENLIACKVKKRDEGMPYCSSPRIIQNEKEAMVGETIIVTSTRCKKVSRRWLTCITVDHDMITNSIWTLKEATLLGKVVRRLFGQPLFRKFAGLSPVRA
jgi:hypothetical protein